jgi:hypothetical protein
MNIMAQEYPLVTIQDIQFLQDSVIQNGDAISPLWGDTVLVRGIVMVRPVVDPSTDRRRIIAAGARWSIYIQDDVTGVWGGINILQNDTVGAAQGTFFDILDTAQVVEFTGVITEFNGSTTGTTPGTTQINYLVDPITPVSIISTLPKRPEPIELNVTDFMQNGTHRFDAEKYEGAYVILRNVITSDRNTSNGTFRVNDANGNYVVMYDQSGYFTLRAHRLSNLTTYQPPQDGTVLEYIRGVINTRVSTHHIVPMYPGDIGPAVQSPPIISSIRRDIVEVNSNQPVEISAKIKDMDGTVTEAKVLYSVNQGARNSVQMTFSALDSLYKGTIPGIASDSALVDFYIWAKDNQDLVSITPVDTIKQKYFYLVLNRPLTIKDAQYSPFGGGYSAYNGYRISLTGVVTSDSSDVKGFGSSSPLKIYMQDGTGPWSGIQIGTAGTMGTQVLNLHRGDEVTVSGVIREDFDVTKIDTLTSISVVSTGNALPEAEVLTTDTIGTSGNNVIGKEEWESVLVQYNNVTIISLSADGTSNFGEIFVNDGSGNTRVELEDGNHFYQNGTRPERPILVEINSTFDAIKGVLYYSFSNYKLIPRKNDDFVNYATDVKVENVLPKEYSISQNYPNPFNPSTTISYALPNSEMVTIRVYNLLGQVVRTLVNQNQSAGTHTISFKADDLTSGIYFYSIQAGSFNQVKKMMLLK